jgi:carbon-monoxide dehydrogenase medium subunit
VKPPPFAYSRPERLDEALDVLAQAGADGKVLAGGQSLVPILNMRLAAPAHLVDINRLTELDVVDTTPAGVRVGATARHARVESDEAAYAVLPLLRRALRLVAHPVIRNRGTTVGSLAHADPAAEMTAVLALLRGTVTVVSKAERRTVEAGEFFLGPLESALQPGELATEAFFPAPPAGTRTGLVEVARRHGDYALCGVAVMVEPSGATRAAYLSVSPTPLVLDLTQVPRDEVAAYVESQVDPEPDIHASAGYRRHLAGVLTTRALRDAA